MTVSIFSVEEFNGLKSRVEQLEVQLAGCGVAALGYGEGLDRDSYGWSSSYENVMGLWSKYEKLLKVSKGGDW